MVDKSGRTRLRRWSSTERGAPAPTAQPAGAEHTRLDHAFHRALAPVTDHLAEVSHTLAQGRQTMEGMSGLLQDLHSLHTAFEAGLVSMEELPSLIQQATSLTEKIDQRLAVIPPEELEALLVSSTQLIEDVSSRVNAVSPQELHGFITTLDSLAKSVDRLLSAVPTAEFQRALEAAFELTSAAQRALHVAEGSLRLVAGGASLVKEGAFAAGGLGKSVAIRVLQSLPKIAQIAKAPTTLN